MEEQDEDEGEGEKGQAATAAEAPEAEPGQEEGAEGEGEGEGEGNEEESQVSLPAPPTFAPIAEARLQGLHDTLVAGTEGWPVERLLALRGALWWELALFKKALKQQHLAQQQGQGQQQMAAVVATAPLTTDALVDRIVAYVAPRG